jgi:hypothetical protein
MRWLFMSLSEKTASWDGFSCLQIRRQNHVLLLEDMKSHLMILSYYLKTWKAISWFCLLTWRHEKPSHDAVFLLEDIKSHLMILSSYLKTWKTISWWSSSKKTESWDGFSCLQVRGQHHEMAFHVFKWEDSIMRWLFMSSSKKTSWCCLLTWRHEKPSLDSVLLLEDMKCHLMILSSHLKTWKAISWFYVFK